MDTYNPDKITVVFENPSMGNLVEITMTELLKNGAPINENGIEMEFVCIQ